MTTIDTTDTGHYSEAEKVSIENRGGAGFGKVYIYWRGQGRNRGEVEAIMLWTASRGLCDCGNVTTSDEQRGRAVRAMCETEWGASALGMPWDIPLTVDQRIDRAFAQLRADV